MMPRHPGSRPAEIIRWLAVAAGALLLASCRSMSGTTTSLHQAMATPATPLHDGAEVAFFPPVTGG